MRCLSPLSNIGSALHTAFHIPRRLCTPRPGQDPSSSTSASSSSASSSSSSSGCSSSSRSSSRSSRSNRRNSKTSSYIAVGEKSTSSHSDSSCASSVSSTHDNTNTLSVPVPLSAPTPRRCTWNAGPIISYDQLQLALSREDLPLEEDEDRKDDEVSQHLLVVPTPKRPTQLGAELSSSDHYFRPLSPPPEHFRRRKSRCRRPQPTPSFVDQQTTPVMSSLPAPQSQSQAQSQSRAHRRSTSSQAQSQSQQSTPRPRSVSYNQSSKAATDMAMALSPVSVKTSRRESLSKVFVVSGVVQGGYHGYHSHQSQHQHQHQYQLQHQHQQYPHQYHSPARL